MPSSATHARATTAECRALWCAVRDGALMGVNIKALEAQFEGRIKPVRVRYLLDQMRMCGFVSSRIIAGRRVWVLGAYDMPGDLGGGADAPITPVKRQVFGHSAPDQAAPEPAVRRVCSIWHLAALCAA